MESLTVDRATPPIYDETTTFTAADGKPFDPVAKGWQLAPIPEPSTSLLALGAIAWLTGRRR
jgi:hypothetical protein